MAFLGDMGRGKSQARAGDRRLTETGEQPTRGLGSGVEGGVPSLKQELGSLCGALWESRGRWVSGWQGAAWPLELGRRHL